MTEGLFKSQARYKIQLGKLQVQLHQVEIYISRPEFSPLFIHCSTNSQGNYSQTTGDGVQGECSPSFACSQPVVTPPTQVGG